MARGLIAGCGYVGAATAELFHRAGWEVEGWTASAESAAALSSAPYPVRAVDLTARDAVAAAGGEFDAVVQCASSRGGGVEDYRRIYLESASHLAAVFPQAQLLFTSSTSVYAQTDGEWVDELSPATPLRPTGRILRETEELVLARGGIVARLAGIYGPGRSGPLRMLIAGDAVLGPDSGRYLNQVHRDDIATALLLLIESSLASESPRIFNVSDNHPLSQHACYEWLAAELHRPLPPPSVIPAPRKRGASNKRVRSEKLLALGWAPRYPTFACGMRESVLPALAGPGA